MAIVFISPKQRQRVFFTGITVVFLLILAAISLGVFLAKPIQNPGAVVFNKPKVSIDMSIFDSQEFKDLQLFPEMGIQYSYKALDKAHKLQTGFLSASSLEEANSILVSQGLMVSEIKEVKVGRADPFMPYYTIPAPAPKKTK